MFRTIRVRFAFIELQLPVSDLDRDGFQAGVAVVAFRKRHKRLHMAKCKRGEKHKVRIFILCIRRRYAPQSGVEDDMFPGQLHEKLFTHNGLRMGVVNCCEEALTLGFAKSREWCGR